MNKLVEQQAYGTSITPFNKGNAFLDYVDEDLGQAGTLMKFVKGEYQVGKDKQKIKLGSRFVAAMDSLSTGYIRWLDGLPTKKRRPIIAPPKISRNDLPDNESDLWERDDNGDPKDPWEPMSSLTLADPETGKVYTFETASRGGRVALDGLRVAYGRVLHQRPSEHPLIELQAGGYDSGKKHGYVHEPVLKIVGWVAKDASEITEVVEPRVAKRDDMDDEIPF
jgi:hypothetical protein